MKIYRVVLEGLGTNSADRIVRLFTDRDMAHAYADKRNAVGVRITTLNVREPMPLADPICHDCPLNEDTFGVFEGAPVW